MFVSNPTVNSSMKSLLFVVVKRSGRRESPEIIDGERKPGRSVKIM